MNLEVGKVYLTRGGVKILIINKWENSHNTSYSGEYVDSSTEYKTKSTWFEGGYFTHNQTEHKDDIISLAEEVIDMEKFTKGYVLVFRKSPTEIFRYENFEEKRDLYKKYKKTLKTASFFKVFARLSDNTYKTILTKQTFVDHLTKEVARILSESGKAKEFYLALKKANDNWSKVIK